jgi:transcriptional regulator with XRE-family HTH domain
LNHSKEILQKSFGIHVKKLRIQKKLTQVEVSSNMNKDQQSLQRLESGNVSPSLFYLFQLSNALNVSLPELMAFEIIEKKKSKK